MIQAAEKRRIRTKEMALTGMMAAVLCVVSPFSIPLPVSPVPLTLATFVLYLSLYLLGTKKALMSCLIYLLIGFAGLPVFSGFAGGIGRLVGPTGGYMAGYLFLLAVGGFFLKRAGKNLWLQAMGLTAGTLGCYGFGTLWLCVQMQMDFAGGLAVGVIPYLPGDAVKILVAVVLGQAIVRAVRRAA